MDEFIELLTKYMEDVNQLKKDVEELKNPKTAIITVNISANKGDASTVANAIVEKLKQSGYAF